MDTLFVAKTIKPVKEEPNVLLNYNRGLAVDQYISVKKCAHVKLRNSIC
jgi:hypothetical protein